MSLLIRLTRSIIRIREERRCRLVVGNVFNENLRNPKSGSESPKQRNVLAIIPVGGGSQDAYRL